MKERGESIQLQRMKDSEAAFQWSKAKLQQFTTIYLNDKFGQIGGYIYCFMEGQ